METEVPDQIESLLDELTTFQDVVQSDTTICQILQRMGTLLGNDYLRSLYFNDCKILLGELMSLCRPTYDPPGGRSTTYDLLNRGSLWLSCYERFYYCLSSGPFGSFNFPSPAIHDNKLEVHMQLADFESKIFGILDMLIDWYVNGSYICTLDAETIQRVTHRPWTDQIVAGRQKLEADFNSYMESISSYMESILLNSASSRAPLYRVWDFHQGGSAASRALYSELAAHPGSHSQLHQVPSTHPGNHSQLHLVPSTHSGSHAMLHSQLHPVPSTHPGNHSQLHLVPSTHSGSHAMLHPVPSTHPGYHSQLHLVPSTHLGNHSQLHLVPSTHSGSHAMLHPVPSTHPGNHSQLHLVHSTHPGSHAMLHSQLHPVPSTHSGSHAMLHPVPSTHPGNHSQLHLVPSTHPGSHRDAGTIQLVTRISSDSLTDPIVASREEPQADFNSDIESVTTPLNSETTAANNATGSHNQNVTQGSPNSTRVEEPRFLETILAITSQTALTMLTIRTNGGSTSFSQNQKILFCLAVAFNVIGFLSFLFAILVRGSQRPGIAGIVTGTGFICTAYAFIGIMGMLLKDNIMLWVTGLAGVALFPVFASAFVK